MEIGLPWEDSQHEDNINQTQRQRMAHGISGLGVIDIRFLFAFFCCSKKELFHDFWMKNWISNLSFRTVVETKRGVWTRAWQYWLDFEIMSMSTPEESPGLFNYLGRTIFPGLTLLMKKPEGLTLLMKKRFALSNRQPKSCHSRVKIFWQLAIGWNVG